MASTSGIGGTSNSGSQSGSSDALRGLDMDQFLKLMIAELQNQDPLNPMENSEMLQQISQIREIGSTDKLTKTLDAVLLGQNLTTASGMLGRVVTGLGEDLDPLAGVVERVSVTDGTPRLHIGDRTMTLNNVGEVLPYFAQ